jgi:hypothetical protein
MPILSLSHSPRADRSFQIALGLVSLFAAAEIFSTGYWYLRRFHVARPATTSVAAARPSATPRVAPTTTMTRTTPAPVTAASPQAPAVVPAPAPAISRIDKLVQEGVAFRTKGDMTNALARFLEASETEPKNAKVLEETAKTYESLELWDRSNETWRKVQELGPSGGASYDLAVTRLKAGAPTPAAPAAPSAAPTVLAALKPATTPALPTEAIPPGTPMFSIAQVKASEEPDPDADTNLTLRISVKKQTAAVIDHTKVKIQVFFYDTVDDKDIKLTNAEVNYEWVTTKHDWAGPDPEVLSVNYLRAKNKSMTSEAALAAAAASVNPNKKGKPVSPSSPPESTKRAYLGYIVRVYYHDELQAQKAEPKRLLKLFPATTAPTP